MDALTPLIIARALDGLSARAEATAINIANANSPGYRPLRVDFEARLRDAARSGRAAIAAATAETGFGAAAPLTAEMRLDLELATASQTAMRYAALIDILGRRMAISRAAVAGGH